MLEIGRQCPLQLGRVRRNADCTSVSFRVKSQPLRAPIRIGSVKAIVNGLDSQEEMMKVICILNMMAASTQVARASFVIR